MSENFKLLSQVEEVAGSPQSGATSTEGTSKAPSIDARIAKELRSLIQQIFFTPPGRTGPKTVLFCGADHGVGCSLMCALAADVLEASGAGSVCLVDADLSKPSLHAYFGVDNQSGLSDALLQSDPILSFVRKLDHPNVSLLPAGSRGPEVESIFTADRVGPRLAELKTEFDYVLIDSSSVARSPDAVTLGQVSDGVILVLAANSTRREAALKARQSFDAAGVRLIGAILNKRTFPIPEGLYHRL